MPEMSKLKERVARREKEIAALKEAQQLLSEWSS